MHLTLHLTGRCNLRCRYCYGAPHSGGDMTFETARAAIDLSMRLAQREQPDRSIGVIFFGGEPLILKDLIKRTVAHCRDLEARTGQLFHYKITTSGIGLDEAFLTDPLTGEIFVALSHDGVREAHDRHRVDAAGRGTFDRLDPVAKMLLACKPYTPAMTVVTPETVPWFHDSIRYLFETGFHYLICSLDYGSEWSRKQLGELERQYRKLADWYYLETMRESKFYFSPFEVKIASNVYPGSCLKNRCDLGRKQISVAPTGRLYPCVQFVGDGTDEAWCIGDVRRGVDEEARNRLYEINAAEKDGCAGCAVRDRCSHTCACLNRQATGRIDRVSPVLCAHERIVLPIADKLASRLFKRRSSLFIQKHYNEMFPLISLIEDREDISPPL